MREALIVLERTRPCPLCEGRMKLCKINVEREGLVFRCAKCDLWQSEERPLVIPAPAIAPEYRLARSSAAPQLNFSSSVRRRTPEQARTGGVNPHPVRSRSR
jgi:hypothetical protein